MPTRFDIVCLFVQANWLLRTFKTGAVLVASPNVIRLLFRRCVSLVLLPALLPLLLLLLLLMLMFAPPVLDRGAIGLRWLSDVFESPEKFSRFQLIDARVPCCSVLDMALNRGPSGSSTSTSSESYEFLDGSSHISSLGDVWMGCHEAR